MLNNVSWSEYLVIMGILTGSYYFFIGAKFYPNEIREFLKGKLRKQNEPLKSSDPEIANSTPSFDELEAVVNDLRYAVLEKTGKPADKHELLNKLQQRLNSYSGLQKPAYRVAINNYIIQHGKEICGVVFSEHELDSAWETLLR